MNKGDAGYWILDTEYWMLDAGYWRLAIKYWIFYWRKMIKLCLYLLLVISLLPAGSINVVRNNKCDREPKHKARINPP
jgi:hypothetical protein